MDKEDEVIRAINNGIFLAGIHLSTGSVVEAIGFCEACLILLDYKTPMLENEFINSIYKIYFTMINGYTVIYDYERGIEYCRKLLDMLRGCGEKNKEGKTAMMLATLYYHQNKYNDAKQNFEKGLNIMVEVGDRQGEGKCYANLGTVLQSLGKHVKAREYLEKAVPITIEIGERKGEAACYENLGSSFHFLRDYDKAKEYHEKALAIHKEIGDKKEEASSYRHLGDVFQACKECSRAKEYFEKSLAIGKDIGDIKGEASSYQRLGGVFQYLGEYVKAEDFFQKALTLAKEVGDRNLEASSYSKLGFMFKCLGDYYQAKEYHEKALAVSEETGNKAIEASSYGNLGVVFQLLGEYNKAKIYLEKALNIRKEIGQREEEATDYGNLGTLFQCLGDYVKAEEYYEKNLVISKEIGDKLGEATSYGGLGNVFRLTGQYGKAKEYLEKALQITEEIGNTSNQAACYGNLGILFVHLGEHCQAKEFFEKARAMKNEIGDKNGEASCCGNLGTMFEYLGQYGKAKRYLEESLVTRKEIGDRKGEASCYANLGTVLIFLGEYDMAIEYLKKALVIAKEIGDRLVENKCYGNLGAVFQKLEDLNKAKIYFDKALQICKEIGDVNSAFKWHISLAWNMLLKGNIHEAFSNLFSSVQNCEYMRAFLKGEDHLKTLLLDEHCYPYQLLSLLFCRVEEPVQALYVSELGRARALADLMCSQYTNDKEKSVNPLLFVDIGSIIDKEMSCICLYISYFAPFILLWIIRSNEIIFRQIDVKNSALTGQPITNLDKFLGNDISFRKFHTLLEGHCEDRSLFLVNSSQPTRKTSHEGSTAAYRIVENDDKDNFEPDPSLSLYYKLIIAPVADLLEEPEIIIVPDRSLYNVPFAALKSESGKYLSETFKIRIVPSLTTLKLIRDSPADYHSQTGALIVGDPEVGHVMYKGRLERKPLLPCARKEAEMIGRLLGSQPLLGKRATKQAVLERINSVSLIHFAAHGNAERGEIALSPIRSTDEFPREADYLLTMSDISQVQLRAKLVVLSCCHSASGQVRAEGVVGIARAFLGSGARSVLVALWALEDSATEQLMSRFYEYLVRGESASVSLHQAMKWMRGNGCSDVRDWAPFMLIGDDVKFDLEKLKGPWQSTSC